MIKKISLLILLISSFTSFSQTVVGDTIKIEDSQTIDLRGRVIDGITQKPLKGAHIFNMNSVTGTVSNNEGAFTILAKVNDTIFLSYIGFQSLKVKITNDLLLGSNIDISLYEKTELIEEIKIKTIQLVGVLEIDAKNVPTDTYNRIHINGLPQTYEVGKPKKRTYSSPLSAIFHPVDFVYNLFGSKPKQLRKLKKMREEDNMREILDSSINRELMLEYLELTRPELNELLTECSYSDYFIKSASDIQVIEAVIQCYEKYRAVKKGTTKKD